MRRCFGDFLRETRSTTAVEFALIGTVLFTFLFGIMMMGLGQFWQMTLDDAVRNATRQVQIRTVATGPDFVTAVCAEFGLAAPNCAASLRYAVQSRPLFATIAPVTVATLSSNANNAFPATLSMGAPLLVQVAYPMPISVPLIPVGFMTGNGTSFLISAIATMVD